MTYQPTPYEPVGYLDTDDARQRLLGGLAYNRDVLPTRMPVPRMQAEEPWPRCATCGRTAPAVREFETWRPDVLGWWEERVFGRRGAKDRLCPDHAPRPMERDG
jgi:hypothetical protein